MTHPALQEYLKTIRPEVVPLVEAIDAVLSGEVGLEPAIKWKQPTYAFQGDYHHWICAVAVTKKGVSLRFHFGSLLQDKDGVLRAGTSKFMRSIEYRSLSDFDKDQLSAYAREALFRLDYFKTNWKEIQAGG